MAERNGKAPAGAVAEVQAAVEGVTLTGQVEFAGRTWRLGEKVGLMPLLKFAHAASQGVGADDMEGLAAMYAMIRDCIHPDDWAAFERAAMDTRADGDDLMAVVEQAMEQIMARPTSARSGSSSPARRKSPSSKGRSSSPELPAAFAKAEAAGDLIGVNDVLR